MRNQSNGQAAEFHGLAGHAGPADGCQKCAVQFRRQRTAAAALRNHQRDVGRRVARMVAAR